MGLPFSCALAYFHEQLATVDQDAAAQQTEKSPSQNFPNFFWAALSEVREMNLRRSQEMHHAPEHSKARRHDATVGFDRTKKLDSGPDRSLLHHGGRSGESSGGENRHLK